MERHHAILLSFWMFIIDPGPIILSTISSHEIKISNLMVQIRFCKYNIIGHILSHGMHII